MESAASMPNDASPTTVPFAALPPAVREFVRAVGREPDAHLAEVFVASDGDMAYRMSRDDEGYALEHPSIRPRLDGRLLISAVSFDDVCRVFVAALGETMPWLPGRPKYGLRKGRTHGDRLDRLREIPLDHLTAAYLGEVEGVLDRLGEPAALHLVDPGLIDWANGAGWNLRPDGGPDSIRFTCRGDVDVALRSTADGFIVERRGEKSNTFAPIASFGDGRSAQEALKSTLRGHR